MSETVMDGLPQPRRFWAIVTVCIGLGMSVLDGAIANLALPTLATEMQVSAASSVWVVNAYQLSVTMVLLPLAALGEIIGYRRVYMVGLVVFTTASFGCAMSHTLDQLVAARVIQGLGAAGMLSVNSALVRFIYPRRLLGQGFGTNMLIGSSTSAAGPSVAAAILAVAGWQWLFAINVPIGIAMWFMGRKTLPPTPRASHKFDIGSAVLNAVSFGLLISGVEAMGDDGGKRVLGLVAIAGALVCGWLLVRRQTAQSSPLLPVDLLAKPVFALSVVAATFSFLAQALTVVCLPFYFQVKMGFSTAETGLLMTPWPVATALVAPFAGKAADRFSAALIGGFGQALLCFGLAMLALLPAQPALWDIAWRTALCGFGFGIFNAPNNRTMIGAAPASRSGSASGMQATSRLLGQTGGTAIAGLLFGVIGLAGIPVALWLGALFAAISAVASVSRRAAVDAVRI